MIWAFCDMPRVLKLTRNHLLDLGYKFSSGQTVTKDTFVDLVNHKKSGDLKFTYKITDNHLIVVGSERQNVRKAAELLSGTVAKAISYIFSGNEHVVDFVNTINDGFDV